MFSSSQLTEAQSFPSRPCVHTFAHTLSFLLVDVLVGDKLLLVLLLLLQQWLSVACLPMQIVRSSHYYYCRIARATLSFSLFLSISTPDFQKA